MKNITTLTIIIATLGLSTAVHANSLLLGSTADGGGVIGVDFTPKRSGLGVYVRASFIEDISADEETNIETASETTTAAIGLIWAIGNKNSIQQRNRLKFRLGVSGSAAEDVSTPINSNQPVRADETLEKEWQYSADVSVGYRVSQNISLNLGYSDAAEIGAARLAVGFGW